MKAATKAEFLAALVTIGACPEGIARFKSAPGRLGPVLRRYDAALRGKLFLNWLWVRGWVLAGSYDPRRRDALRLIERAFDEAGVPLR